MRLARLCLVLVAVARGAAGAEAGDVATAIAKGDAHYAARAHNADGPRAQTTEVDAAIAGYRAALAIAPNDEEAAFKFQRAIHFRAALCGANKEEQRAFYDAAARQGQAAVDAIAKGDPPRDRRAVRAELFYWTAASWGRWGLLMGKFWSVRKGVAGRVRDLAQASIDLDPGIEEGGGYRILGRLHDQAPRIIFITGWISGTKGLGYLRRSHEIGPDNVVTSYFLAEAILDREPEHRDEALELLTRLAAHEPRADYQVEEAFYRQAARDKLATLTN